MNIKAAVMIMIAGLMMAAGGVLQTSLAAGSSGIVTVTFIYEAKTCAFKDDTQTIDLGDIAANDFRDNSIRSAKDVTIGFTCDDGVSAVNITTNGSYDSKDNTAYANTGNATNVALRLLDKDGNVLPANVVNKIRVEPVSGEGSYTFKAGYVATAPGDVTAGNFASSITFNFDYP